MKKAKRVYVRVSMFLSTGILILGSSISIFTPVENRIDTEDLSLVYESETRVSRFSEANQTDEIVRSRKNVNDADFHTNLIRQQPEFADKTASVVKSLSDFNGYTYFIIECEPTGYIIYDNQFSTALELNSQAESPYLNETNNLIYGGPTYYYIKPEKQPRNGNELYTHTVLDSDLSVDTNEKKLLVEESKKMSRAVESIEKAPTQSRSVKYEYAGLSKYESITKRSTLGFNELGNCGYIAASLIVWYHYDVKGWGSFVPQGTYNNNLVKSIQGNRGNSSWGPDLQSALSDWSYGHGAKGTILFIPYNKLPASTWFIPTAAEIFSLMSQDRPVALLGSLPDETGNKKINHAVTITGAERKVTTILGFIKTYSDYYYWAHYGWEDVYNDVMIHDSLSTMLKGAAVFY